MDSTQKNPSFLSLPDEIILTCLALIPRSYYPKLVLVCKTFRSIIVSKELNDTRSHLKTQETVFQVCLQFTNDPCPSWFTLWNKPGQILTNQLEEEKTTMSTQNIRLVPITSSCCYYYEPLYTFSVGLERYGISQSCAPSSNLWVFNKENGLWRKAPNMSVAREKAIVSVFNGKIYVVGGCAACESSNWGEVFDTKTQTWESLPDPGPGLRFTSIRQKKKKLYVLSNDVRDYVYDPKEGKWDVKDKSCMQCFIDNVEYCIDQERCWWFDEVRGKWRAVRGLHMLNNNRRNSDVVEIANYNGKLLVLWDEFGEPGCKDIWCAVISPERRNGSDAIWGNVEWASIVLTVPSSYVFLRGRRYVS